MPLSENAARLIETLNQRHQQLAATLADGPPDALEVERLIADIIAAGTSVPTGPERDRLRNLLYFWVSDQVGREQRPRDSPLPVLLDYIESPDAPEVDAAEAGDAKPATETGTSDDSSANAEARALVSIAALAQQWEQAADGDNRGYLLWGKALAQAELFVDRDPEIRAFVAASAAAENAFAKKKRLMWSALYGLGIAVFVAATTAAVFYHLKAESAKQWAELTLKERDALVDANTALLTKSDRLRALTQQAIDGLNSDQLGPLEQLMKASAGGDIPGLDGTLKRLRFSAATPGLLDEVATAPQQAAPPSKREAAAPSEQKAAAPSTRRAAAPDLHPPMLAAVPVVQSSMPTAAPAPQAPALTATCSGYLWFGSKNDSKLKDGRDPNTLQPDETVTLNDRNTIRLRADWPSDKYVITPQIGLVPGGSEVMVTGKPKTGRGSKGEQVFAQVRVPRTFCTTVYVQYTGEKKKLTAVMDKLRELGVQTPAPENTVRAKGLSEVRYFWPEDKVVAEQVGASLAASNGGNQLRVVDLASFATKPSKGTIEVWLDLT